LATTVTFNDCLLCVETINVHMISLQRDYLVTAIVQIYIIILYVPRLRGLFSSFLRYVNQTSFKKPFLLI